MSTKTQLKKMTDSLKSNFDLDFDRVPFHRLKDEIMKAYKNDDLDRSYKLDIASDIKELLSDQGLNPEDRTFQIDALLTIFHSLK